jgi:hypothetical protein
MLPAIASLACLPLGAGDAQPAPVLVELFTSEGCSSCPPADSLLESLDKRQPIAGVRIIVLSEHVDYWNHDGWVDPFSSAEFTRRQQAYDLRLGVSEPYTPQMVIDGSRECLGNDAAKVEASIRQAALRPMLPLRVTAGARPNSAAVEVDVAASGSTHGAEVYAAFARDRAEDDVLRGENQGRRLSNVAILRKFKKLGKLREGAVFRAEFSVAQFAGQRLIAFVQEPGGGPVLGAALYRIP